MKDQTADYVVRECSSANRQYKNRGARCARTSLYKTYLSGDTDGKSDLFPSAVWIRREAVRTNWPTVAEKPERKALKGYCLGVMVSFYPSRCGDSSFVWPVSVLSYIIAREDAVEELERADGDEEGHEGIEELGPLRRVLDIVVGDVGYHLVPALLLADNSLPS